MPTLTIELTDEQAKMLAQEAERLHLSLQELAVQRVAAPPAAPDFDEAMEYVFRKNAELYRRLA